MRMLWLCLSSSLVATGSAAWVLVPHEAAPEGSDGRGPMAPRLAARPASDAPAMSLPRLARAEIGCRLEAMAAPEAGASEASHLEASLLATRRELADARAELDVVQARLQDAKRDLELLLKRDCHQRFTIELDAWLDGSLEPFHGGDQRRRGHIRVALAKAAGARVSTGRGCTSATRSGTEDCPEEVALLRQRISDGLVAQLASLLSGWDAELATRPHFIMGCGNSPTVTLEHHGVRSEWERGHPYLQQLHDERTRITRDWQQRINALLGVEVYDLE